VCTCKPCVCTCEGCARVGGARGACGAPDAGASTDLCACEPCVQARHPARAQARLDAELLGNLGRYRRYRAGSLRDLLRVIRNKHNHWRELPEPLQARLGPPPDGFLLCAPNPNPNPPPRARTAWRPGAERRTLRRRPLGRFMSQDTAAPRQCAGRGWDVALLEPRGSAQPRARRYFKERFPRLMLTTFCFALRHCAREPGLARFFPPAAAEFPFQTPAGAAARAAERDALGARHRPAPTPPLVRPRGPEGVRQERPVIALRAWQQAPVSAVVRAANLQHLRHASHGVPRREWLPRGLGQALRTSTGESAMCLVTHPSRTPSCGPVALAQRTPGYSGARLRHGRHDCRLGWLPRRCGRCRP